MSHAKQPPQLKRLAQRTVRWVFVLAMACFLGLSGHAHSHASRAATDLRIQAPGAEAIMGAAQADEACAICLWKAHTPYVPSLEAPVALIVAGEAEQPSVQTRAPPALATTYFQNRAPPTLLS